MDVMLPSTLINWPVAPLHVSRHSPHSSVTPAQHLPPIQLKLGLTQVPVWVSVFERVPPDTWVVMTRTVLCEQEPSLLQSYVQVVSVFSVSMPLQSEIHIHSISSGLISVKFKDEGFAWVS